MKIITGCARSGTSFVAQVLRELGGEFGAADDLIDGDEWNPRGYLENKEVNTLNHRLLFGRWSNPELWVDFMWPKDRWIRLRKLGTLALSPILCRPGAVRRRGEKMAGQIASLSSDFEGKMVKDPRFCYLMEPWQAHAAVEKVLYVVRHPWESASSMARQTRLPLAATYRAWADSVTRFAGDASTSYVDFNAFFDEEKREAQMRTLFDFADARFDGSVCDDVLARVLEKGLRNRKAAEIRLPASIGRLYEEVLSRTRTRAA